MHVPVVSEIITSVFTLLVTFVQPVTYIYILPTVVPSWFHFVFTLLVIWCSEGTKLTYYRGNVVGRRTLITITITLLH